LGQPAPSLADDRGELSCPEEAAEAVGERPQQAAGEEDPRLRIGVAVGRDRTRSLTGPHSGSDEVVYLAHVGAEVGLHLLVVTGLGDPLDPEVRQEGIRPRAARLRDGTGGLVIHHRRDPVLVLDPLAQLAPGLVEARKPELLLGREVAVDDRLGYARYACD